jgi:hypothetical protein
VTEARQEYEQNAYAECADRYADARSFGALRATQAYDAACCSALAGRANEAFGWLETANAAGYRDPSHLGRDADLTSLHGDVRWSAIIAASEANRDRWRASVHSELLDLYEADQADRRTKPIDWAVVEPRDTARRARVDAILAAGEAKVSADWYHAAMVYQHGPELDDTRRARELALKALEIEPVHEPARWLAAAAEDRILVREGKPQKWGTQFHKEPDGPWKLWEVDPSVTDAERAAWNVPPLAEAQKKAAEMNR